MKRIFALLFALCLILCACGNQEEEYPKLETTETPTTVATEPTTEPTEPEPVIIRHPMNGSVVETLPTSRATAIVLSNDTDALPQHGLSQASFIFEAEVEGGVTRLLAIFPDISLVENKIGPIRSARSFFNNVSLSFNAPIIHCGGSQWGINGYLDENTKIENWAHINEQNNGSYFYRDPERSNYLSWLNLFTNSEKLVKGLTDKEYMPDGQTVMDFGYTFDENVVLNGETANSVTMNFRGSKTTSFTYDATSGLYSARQYNRDHIDGNTGKALTYKNILCLYTKQYFYADSNYTRSFYTLIGEGTGHFACNGQIIPIKWSRAEATAPFSFTLEDGTPITLGVGMTYVGIADSSASASYE